MSLQTHPKWKYSATAPACVVATPEDEAALGAGWYDSPALVPAHDDSSPFIVEVPAVHAPLEATVKHSAPRPHRGKH
jgi:hypothetical protein